MIKDLYEVPSQSGYGWHSHDEFSNPNLDPLVDINSRVEHKYHFRSQETGIYDPHERSVVKIRGNGAVDVFAEEENGNRYDREEQATNDFTNDRKIHIFSETEWVAQNSSSFVQGHRVMKTYGTTYIFGLQNVTMESADNFNFFVFNTLNRQNQFFIDGHVNLRINGDVKAIFGGNVQQEVMGNVQSYVHGDHTATVEGSMVAAVQGDTSIESSSIALKSAGDLSVEAGGKLTLGGSEIEFV